MVDNCVEMQKQISNLSERSFRKSDQFFASLFEKLKIKISRKFPLVKIQDCRKLLVKLAGLIFFILPPNIR